MKKNKMNIINNGGDVSIIRFTDEPILESEISIPESSFPALRAWKARPGEIITISDKKNSFYRARLSHWDGNTASAQIFNCFPANHENRVKITVFQALPEKERFELVLQKLTEIGVASIIPFVSKKSITFDERDSSQKKSHKWPDVILRAAKQCRRGIIPELGEVMKWENLMNSVGNYSRAIILSEHGEGNSMGNAIHGINSGSICLITGPEGGFTRKEMNEAKDMGAIPVSLGSRILRTETASIVAATIAVYAAGGFSYS